MRFEEKSCFRLIRGFLFDRTPRSYMAAYHSRPSIGRPDLVWQRITSRKLMLMARLAACNTVTNSVFSVIATSG